MAAPLQLPDEQSQTMGGPIDKASPVPLYFQIAGNLRKAIADGLLAPGGRLENEMDLAARLGVSRPTVRQAIQSLVHDGLVVRRRGSGTVVANEPIRRPVALTSLYDDLEVAGREPTTSVSAVATVEADAAQAAVLGVPAGSPVLVVDRLRSAAGQPLAIMHNVLPAALLQGSDPAQALAEGGLYHLLRTKGVQFHKAEQLIGARRATSAEARLLEAPRGSTVLTMERTAFDPSGRPIEHGRHAYLADRYTFRVVVTGT